MFTLFRTAPLALARSTPRMIARLPPSASASLSQTSAFSFRRFSEQKPPSSQSTSSTTTSSPPTSGAPEAPKASESKKEEDSTLSKLQKEFDVPEPKQIPDAPDDLPEMRPVPRTRTVRSASGEVQSEAEEAADGDDLWIGFPANMSSKRGNEAVTTKDLGDKIEYSWSPGQGQGDAAKYVVTKVTPEMRAERARKSRPLLFAIMGTIVGVYAYTFYKMTENPWKEVRFLSCSMVHVAHGYQNPSLPPKGGSRQVCCGKNL